MKITGSYTIDAPRDQVWSALNDMEVLARIVPGCERLVQTGENEFEGTVKIGIQSIKGTYSGKIRLEDIQAPHHYKLVASGRSSNGVVDGSGTVDLAEQDGKTILTYGGDAQIGGTLASVGQRLIEGASKQMINQSLKALVEQINARNAPATPPEPAPAAELAAAAPSTSNGVSAPSEVRVAEGATAIAAEVDQARPAFATAESAAAPATRPLPAFEQRTVVVPDHEQLKPESVVRGVVEDVLKERPWLPWVVIAFLLGVLFGRARRNS
ncbi:MAG TPA: carbon monoxide dehydrogenase subunit G [Roseiflexaceae bacterium]|nr:carbon monoxide dehydrogenase subunit G [Roseiflexaceae bacterium]